ncbi:MAG: DUF1820 family protein [Acidobacteriota bacterium]
MEKKRLFRVSYLSQGRCYEIYARQVSQGGLFGFIEVEDLIFGEKTQIVVDPTEEQLQREFEGVKRFHVPMHAVLRIDEVEKEGVSRITSPSDKDSNVATFPVPIYSPTDSGNKG